MYRRRRAVAFLALAAVALATAVGLRLALAGLGGGALTTAGPSGAAAAPTLAAAQVYIVQPGDTLWSIVRGTGPGRDPRPEVDALARQLNGRPIHPGQHLLIP